ncbi:MAG: ribose 5-phosphate isomerase B [Bacteroidales bacterium]|nr:ribose 5-phosphate isomerase B [Bacteroidales bacterium]
MSEIIPIASDHAGFNLKERIKDYLQDKGFEVKDFGCFSDESVDYPDIIHPIADQINNGNYKFGFIMCGSGNGVSMVANKYQNIRCALCWNTDISVLAKKHNNANIIALPARFITFEDAKGIIDAYLSTDFEGGRHQRRIEKIPIKFD